MNQKDLGMQITPVCIICIIYNQSSEPVCVCVYVCMLTGLDDHQVQWVIPDIGDSSNIMDGHSQDDVLSITPHKLYVVRRQAHHCVLLWCQLACQLMRLLTWHGQAMSITHIIVAIII